MKELAMFRLAYNLIASVRIESTSRQAVVVDRIGFRARVPAAGRGGVPVGAGRVATGGRGFAGGSAGRRRGVVALIRATGGNIRLLGRLLSQVGRILEFNGLGVVSRETVEGACEVLLIGVA
jgi:hypothetical protein